MANALFNKGREGFLAGTLAWGTGTIKVALVRGYTFNATHSTLSNVLATGTVAATQTLASKTVTDGTADAADVTFPAVASNASSHALVVYQEKSAVDTDRWLIAYLDTGTNLPVTPNGGDITITWDNGANKIFTL